MARLPETIEGLKAVANHETRVQKWAFLIIRWLNKLDYQEEKWKN